VCLVTGCELGWFGLEGHAHTVAGEIFNGNNISWVLVPMKNSYMKNFKPRIINSYEKNLICHVYSLPCGASEQVCKHKHFDYILSRRMVY